MDSTTEALALGAATGAIAALLVLLRLHLLPGGRARPLRTLGEVGRGPNRAYHRALLALLGVAGALLAAALERGSRASAAGLVLLAVFAAARLASAPLRPDPPGAGSPARRARAALAALAFTAVALGAAEVTSAVQDSPGWREGAGAALRVASDAVGVTAVLALAAHVIPAACERGFAIAERLLYLATIAWLIVAAVRLASLAAGGA